MTNADCSNGQICEHNICVLRPPPPASSSTSTKFECKSNKDCPNGQICQNNTCIIVPPPLTSTVTSSASPPVGCTTDSDCAGRYPWPAVCKHNICVRYRPFSNSTTSIPPVGCSSDSDCVGRCSTKACICEHNICVPKPIPSSCPSITIVTTNYPPTTPVVPSITPSESAVTVIPGSPTTESTSIPTFVGAAERVTGAKFALAVAVGIAFFFYYEM